MIQFHNVSKQFGAKKVFEDVSFNIQKGSKVGVIGGNASGKSTLVNLMSGLIVPDKGSITVLNSAPTYRIRHQIGFVLSEPLYIEDFTGEEYFRFVCKFQHIDKAIVSHRIKELCSWIDFHDLSRKIKSLSTGNKMKVSIITSLLNNPFILIWDEPFRSLDETSILSVKRYILEMEKTFLITAHSVKLIEDFCDFFLIMDRQHTVRVFKSKNEASHYFDSIWLNAQTNFNPLPEL